MKTKPVCQLDGDNYFIGMTVAHISPLEKDVYLIPAGCIDTKEPIIPLGKRAYWINGVWQYEDIPMIPDTIPDPIPDKTKNQQAQAILDEHMFFTNNYYWNRFTNFEKQEFTKWFDTLHHIAANANYTGDVPEKPLFMTDLSQLTPEQVIERTNAINIQSAHDLLIKTERFETSSFQAKYWTEEQEAEFELWRHKLFDVVYEGASDIPPPPDFVQQMLDGNAQLPQLLQSVATPEETKPKKRKTKSITE